MQNFMITPNTIIRRSEVIIHTDMGDETAMMDNEKGLYYGLDDVGSRLWALVEQPVAVRHLCDQLTSEYSVGPERCLEEVTQLLDDLLNRGIVEVVADTKP